MGWKELLVLVGGACVAGCGGSYIYRPVGRATVQLPDVDLPAATYSVPPSDGRMQGAVKIAALGVRPFKNSDGQELGVRVVIENNSDDTWLVDVLHQLLVSDGGRQQPPTHVHRPPSGSPLTAVPPHTTLQLEYFYPLSPSDHPSHFQLAWSLWTPRLLIVERTAFRRDDNRGEGPYYADLGPAPSFPFPDGPSPFSTFSPLGPSWALAGARPPKAFPVPVAAPR